MALKYTALRHVCKSLTRTSHLRQMRLRGFGPAFGLGAAKPLLPLCARRWFPSMFEGPTHSFSALALPPRLLLGIFVGAEVSNSMPEGSRCYVQQTQSPNTKRPKPEALRCGGLGCPSHRPRLLCHARLPRPVRNTRETCKP